MPSYLIYAPTRFPEVFNAVKELGETAVDMPNIVALLTDKDIDNVTELVRSVTGSENSLIVQTKHAQYKGDGNIASIGQLLEKL